MPISSVYVLTTDWILGLEVCQLWLSADYTASTSSILNLLILSMDRYWSIRSPLKYMRKRTKKRALVMIGFVWILSALWIVPIIGWHYWYKDGVRTISDSVCETEFADNVPFKLTTSIVNFYVPMTLMIVIYVKIFMEIKKRSSLEIGKCKINTGATNSSCEYSIGGAPEANVNEPSPRSTHCQSASGSRAALKENNCTKCAYESEKFAIRSDRNVERDSRFSQLTVVSCQRNPKQDACWQKQHFNNVEVKIEYIGDSSAQVIDNTDKPGSSTPRTSRIYVESNKSPVPSISRENRTQVRDVCQMKPVTSSKAVKKLSHKSCMSNTGHLNEELKSYNHTLEVPNSNTGGKLFRSPSSRLSIHPTAGIMPTIGTALRLKVTRKNPHLTLSQEKKAARQLGVIIGAFVLCWMPYMTIFMVTAQCQDCISPHVHTIAIWLGYVNSTINPFLYALCNANFKRAFNKIFYRYTGKHMNAGTASLSNRAELYG